MKKILFALASFFVTTIAVAQEKVADVAQFKAETIELGKIKVGTPTTATFQVTNIGKQPLIIETANPTCGCTIGDYTKSPIAPGKNGIVTATYNAATLGAFTKTMTVKFAGVAEVTNITIKGEVLSAEDFAKLPPGSANTGSIKTSKTAKTAQTANSTTSGQKAKVANQ